ncbi:MAG TPA: sigma 54-interacting transcriptional regulator [Polyangiaceae bacterium]|nr:sigma 54-interacting transcriptional regulator [Polyangiaceae bacterium]
MARKSAKTDLASSPPLSPAVALAAPPMPPRYEAVRRLGEGGGGEVWHVRDRVDGRSYALKALAEGASEGAVLALVREASVLSGLEGLGTPRVVRFGRLPGSGRGFLLRDLVAGASLAERLAKGIAWQDALRAVLQTADRLTRLHRASLLHGDIKPANIIVGDDGAVTLVDLGLATPWREGHEPALGLSPGYAAPELLAGAAPTVRTEVYALGTTLRDVSERLSRGPQTAELAARLAPIVARATAREPGARYPSVDELASAVRRAAQFAPPSEVGLADAAWPILGLDAAVGHVLGALGRLEPGAILRIRGRTGSGRTALLRRLAWSLGVEGHAVAWVEARVGDAARALEAELEGVPDPAGAVLLVDDFDLLPEGLLGALGRALGAGAKLVIADAGARAAGVSERVESFAMPPLEPPLAASLLHRAMPSLNEAAVSYLVARADGLPGRLRSFVRRLGAAAAVSPADVERALDGPPPPPEGGEGGDPLAAAERLLDQGRSREAAPFVALLAPPEAPAVAVTRARWLLARGDADGALAALALADEGAGGPEAARRVRLYRARALLRKGAYADAMAEAGGALERVPAPPAQSEDPLDADLLACRGVAASFLGGHDEALATLRGAAAIAARSGDRRAQALALGSLALALQRNDRLSEAKQAYEQALEAAEEAGDLGAVATTRLNLAALATHGQGAIAEALEHLEAAVDLGRRAGRDSTVQQALLNLANLDLYLGRWARAAASLEALETQHELSPGGAQYAQWLGLQAELAARTGEARAAAERYEACAAAYEALGRTVDAAEARIEAVLVAARGEGAEPAPLAASLERAAATLGDAGAHRAPLCLARAAVAALARDESKARRSLDEALEAARREAQKEWVWRALEQRSRLELESGRPLAARRDAEEALAVLEDIATRLPRDLREVYWNDPRRAAIRAAIAGDVSRHNAPATQPAAEPFAQLAFAARTLTRPPPDDERLARILEINRELATVRDPEQVLERVIAHAVSLAQAERGFVLLRDAEGALTVHAARERAGESDQRFSKSIAERALATGEPIISLNAVDDERMRGFASVHENMLQSVACVPVRSPRGAPIGALYLETRTRRGNLFEREVGVLRAFADQAAVAIENARLLDENARRADALARANAELEAARARLAGQLDQKTVQLEITRKDLKDTRAVLRGHFGYHGLVGTSAAMRRVYALVDRVKDTDIPVLITGESGTGKEVVARALHQAGPRAKKPFTGINCGAIPANLLESELFGHAKGAFTGADRERKGLFRESAGGTVLLDEIGEMPFKMQAGLLRVLQEKLVRPVGGSHEEPIDVRIVAATHRDLTAMVSSGAFREDLYYRLRVVEVHVPPLRGRPEDIPLLIDHFLQRFAVRYRRDKGSVSREALRALTEYPWPGNVRQLEHVLLNAWVLSESAELDRDAFDLPPPSRLTPDPASAAPSQPRLATAAAAAAPPADATSSAERRNEEKQRILEALQHHNWNRVRAAQALRMPRRTFYRRLKDYGIQ